MYLYKTKVEKKNVGMIEISTSCWASVVCVLWHCVIDGILPQSTVKRRNVK